MNLSVLAIFAFAAIVGLARGEDVPAEVVDEFGGAIELNEENFDSQVFPENVPFSAQKSFFIFFYAPWCGHCKKTKPLFYDASKHLQASQWKDTSAKFALVDATVHKTLAKRFNVKSFPTFFYSVNGRAYSYEGGRSVNEFVQIAVYVERGRQLGSFADDVTTPERFDAVDVEAPGRSAFITYIPKDSTPMDLKKGYLYSSGLPPSAYDGLSDEEVKDKEKKERELALPFLWRLAVESSISLGKTRFGVIYESRLPNSVSGDHGLFSRVVEMARRCQAGTKGPNGEVMVLVSDAHKKPLCYFGPWVLVELQRNGAVSPFVPQGVARVNIHKDLRDWIDRNSFLAVEEITAETYSLMARRPGLMMVLVTEGPLPKTDTSMLPMIREIVQERNAVRISADESLKSNVEIIDQSGANAAPKIDFVFGQLDGLLFHEWCKEHGVTSFPALVAVAPMKELAYHIPAELNEYWESRLQFPWAVGGVQHRDIKRFMAMIERNEVVPHRVSTIGKIAETLLKVPFAVRLHELLGSDDTSFLAVVFVVFFTIFVLALALRPDSSSRKQEADAVEYFKELERRQQQQGSPQAASTSAAATEVSSNEPGKPSALRRRPAAKVE